MDIIPVLDVMDGQVVRAVKGDRTAYKPIQSPLFQGSLPVDAAIGYRTLYPFRKFYIADLDGIEGHGRNTHLVPELSRAVPHAEIWVDAGTGSRGAARTVLAAPVATLVVGSESLENAASFADIMKEASQRTVLSLDFRGDEFMGPQPLIDNPELWPDRVIVMTLQRVGSDDGPDLARIAQIAKRCGGRKVYAAGGVRDRRDLDAASAAGATGALVSTALHGQKITASDLSEVAGRLSITSQNSI